MEWLKDKLKIHGHWLLGVGAVLLLAFLIAVITYYVSNVSREEYWKGFSIEAGSKVYDIILIVFLLGSYEVWRQKKEKIAELRRRINDFKKLDNEYAHVIIGASLRELKDFRVTDIDFKGITLSNFRFNNDHDIESIKGSEFSGGFYVKNPSKNFTELTSVDFGDVDCSNVIFGKGILSFGAYKNCRFWNTKLNSASFCGARLEWDKSSVIIDPDGWNEVIDETKEGEPIYCQTYRPAFDGADLSQAIFDGARISYADFRGAKNIQSASFKNVSGIDTCIFDDGVLEQLKVTRGD